MLSEINQSQEDKYCVIPLIWEIWSSQKSKRQKEWWGRGWREGGTEWVEFQLSKMKKVLQMDGGDFIFGGSKITADGDCSHEIKRHSLEGKLWPT